MTRKPRAVLVHGAFTRDGGANSVGRLRPCLSVLGYETELVSIGYWDLFRILFGRRFSTDRELIRALWNADLIIGHSLAGTMTDRALDLMPPSSLDQKRVLVLFAPSLNCDEDPPDTVAHRVVVHSERDVIIRASGWIPFSRLGRMGAIGYCGNDPRNTNLDHTKQNGVDHSAYFKGDNAWHYAELAHQLRTEVLS